MNSKLKFRLLIAVALAVVCMVTCPFVFGYFGNTFRRVNREHGLRIPSSASHLVCRGDAWIPVLDRTAVTTFQIARADLSAFTNQLRVRPPDDFYFGFRSTNYDGQRHLFPSPHYSVTNIATYYCDSPTGDFLFVDLWDVDDSRVGVCLYTDWN